MGKRIICNLTTDELRTAYMVEGRTLAEMCDIIGAKSAATVSKILKENGIEVIAAKNTGRARLGMTKDQFRQYLEDEYASGKSLREIGESIGVTSDCVRGYFERYGIARRKNTDFLVGDPTKNPNWHGGKRVKRDGYIEVFCPDHPNANKRKCVYEHQLIMEEAIGRYLVKGEVVHHLDGNKCNNDLSNLVLLTNPEHARLHAILRRGERRMKGEF